MPDHPLVALLVALSLFGVAVPARAQDDEAGPLSGTLKKIRASGVVTIGYRTDSFPFSYLSPTGVPLGYSIDLCLAIVDDVSNELDGRELKVEYRAVTAGVRMQAVVSGEIDLECGSTTSNAARRKEVDFSPILFVSGTKLLVRRADRIRSYRDLAHKTVVVTAGTTNEQALQTLIDRQKLDIKLTVARSHEEAFESFAAGAVHAFATDDILLYGWIARSRAPGKYQVVGEYLSYDPYGIMFRKDDPQFAAVVDRTFNRLAETSELRWIYRKWFQRRVPTGENLGLPMSDELRSIFGTLGLPEE